MKLPINIKQLASLLEGRIIGSEEGQLWAPEKIELAQQQHVAFLANEKYLPFVESTKAGVIVVSEGFPTQQYPHQNFVVVDNAYARFSSLLEAFQAKSNKKSGIHPQAVVDPTAKIHPSAWVGPGAVVEAGVVVGAESSIEALVWLGPNVSIGSHSILYPGVKIYDQCMVGNEVIIHANVVIGSDGFGFAPQADGSYKKVPQTGNVVIADRVEIGANTVIDRAMMGSTKIEEGVKLDNLVQIAHNVVVGAHTVIAAQTGISGSTTLGKNIVVGGQAGFGGHIHVADKSTIGAQSGVNRNITEVGKKWNGTPLLEYMESMRALSILRKLPEIVKRLEKIEKNSKNNLKDENQ